jgi:N-acetyl-gamma-glutamyl-phosphate reductase
MEETLRAGVFGASGYSGAELLRYLNLHPSIEVAWVTADRKAGKRLADVFGHLVGYGDLVLQPSDPAAAPDLDVAFLALPHGAAAHTGRALRERGVKVVDLSADWRLRDPAAYEEWYGWSHPFPDELGAWVYGLPETHRDEIAAASAVANPGCYPTAAVLALAPALRATDGGWIAIDAVSGVSGAGRKDGVDYSFSELDASVTAYGVGTHRHTPEIEQELGVRVTFTPHLVPMARGELVTCYVRGDAGAVRDTLEIAYKDEPFVHVLPEGVQPATKQVSGSSHALIGVAGDARNGVVVVTCAIDNLGKGAAGQALQNANLMLGLDESTGLGAIGVYP